MTPAAQKPDGSEGAREDRAEPGGGESVPDDDPSAEVDGGEVDSPAVAMDAGGEGPTDTLEPDEPPPPCGRECSAPRPICDEASGVCVACLQEDDCSDSASPYCIDQRCVSCRTSADCGEPTAARCDAESHMCVGCQENADCENVMDGEVLVRVCAEADHRCVQCTGLDFTDACGLYEDGKTPLVCDSTARQCTTRRAGILRACASCVSDAECAPGLKCVQETVDGVGLGYACHLVLGDEASMLSSCQSPEAGPYRFERRQILSMDGQEVTACALRRSTCVATQEFPERAACSEAGSYAGCGAEEVEDAICVATDPAAADDRLFCAPLCSNSDDCTLDHACVTTAEPRYCDPDPSNCYSDADCDGGFRCESLTCVPL